MEKETVLLADDFNEYVPPSWDVLFMGLAYDFSYKSKDPSTKIGAVIVRDKRPILFGYNGLPRKVKDLPERMVRPVKYKYMIHAERNCFYCGSEFGIATQGTTMYTQALPCVDCCHGIINAGVVKVTIHKAAQELYENHPTWKEGCYYSTEMFNEAGVEVVILRDFLSKHLYMDGKIYWV